jgi:hypothetical protein
MVTLIAGLALLMLILAGSALLTRPQASPSGGALALSPTPAPAAVPSLHISSQSPGDIYVGFRASGYGITPLPPPEYWYRTANDASGKFSGSAPGGVWVIGYVGDDGQCYLNFPSQEEYADIEFSETDENERYLRYFDLTGVSVYLQVEPGQADVADLIRLVLDRYSCHPCVAGFGIDVEWYRCDEYPEGKPVTDEEASRWYSLVSSYNKSYRLFLKHWMADRMPPACRNGLYFIDDSMGFASLDKMEDEFIEWGRSFPDNPVGFQIGYPDDKSWWGEYDDPYSAIGHALVDSIPNARGIYWVDFSITEVYPE